MTRIIALGIFAAAFATAQNAVEANPGTVSGTVIDAPTDQPLPDVELIVYGGRVRGSAVTDSQGRYSLDDLPPGRFTIGLRSSQRSNYSGSRVVNIRPGQHLRSIDFRLYPNPSVSGRITDENDEPMPGQQVVLLGREYFMGKLRYYRRATARTNDNGEYRIVVYRPLETAWLVWAAGPNLRMNPISDAPDDPKMRRRAIVPTYYPGVPTAGEATLLRLGPGEQREGVDFRMIRSQSYCIEAQIDAPGQRGEVRFWIHAVEPGYRMGATGGVTGIPPGGIAGADRKLRICDLWPDKYRLTAVSGDRNAPDLFGTTTVNITGRDVRNVRVAALPRLALPGRVVWTGEPPETPIEDPISIVLFPIERTFGGGGDARAPVPGKFSIRREKGLGQEGEVDPLIDEYSIRIFRLPPKVYIEEVTYGGASVLHKPLRLGSALAGAELRVVLNHNGGSIKARVSEDGQPVGDATVVIIPKHAVTHLQIAEARTAGRTDQNGEYESPALAPGAYLVLADAGDYTDVSPETKSALFEARSKAKEVEVGPNATLELALEPAKLDR